MQTQTLPRTRSTRRVHEPRPTITPRSSPRTSHHARIMAPREKPPLPWDLVVKLGLISAITVASVYLFVLPIVSGVMQIVSKLTS